MNRREGLRARSEALGCTGGKAAIWKLSPTSLGKAGGLEGQNREEF